MKSSTLLLIITLSAVGLLIYFKLSQAHAQSHAEDQGANLNVYVPPKSTGGWFFDSLSDYWDNYVSHGNLGYPFNFGDMIHGNFIP